MSPFHPVIPSSSLSALDFEIIQHQNNSRQLLDTLCQHGHADFIDGIFFENIQRCSFASLKLLIDFLNNLFDVWQLKLSRIMFNQLTTAAREDSYLLQLNNFVLYLQLNGLEHLLCQQSVEMMIEEIVKNMHVHQCIILVVEANKQSHIDAQDLCRLFSFEIAELSHFYNAYAIMQQLMISHEPKLFRLMLHKPMINWYLALLSGLLSEKNAALYLTLQSIEILSEHHEVQLVNLCNLIIYMRNTQSLHFFSVELWSFILRAGMRDEVFLFINCILQRGKTEFLSKEFIKYVAAQGNKLVTALPIIIFILQYGNSVGGDGSCNMRSLLDQNFVLRLMQDKELQERAELFQFVSHRVVCHLASDWVPKELISTLLMSDQQQILNIKNLFVDMFQDDCLALHIRFGLMKLLCCIDNAAKILALRQCVGNLISRKSYYMLILKTIKSTLDLDHLFILLNGIKSHPHYSKIIDNHIVDVLMDDGEKNFLAIHSSLQAIDTLGLATSMNGVSLLYLCCQSPHVRELLSEPKNKEASACFLLLCQTIKKESFYFSIHYGIKEVISFLTADAKNIKHVNHISTLIGQIHPTPFLTIPMINSLFKDSKQEQIALKRLLEIILQVKETQNGLEAMTTEFLSAEYFTKILQKPLKQKKVMANILTDLLKSGFFDTLRSKEISETMFQWVILSADGVLNQILSLDEILSYETSESKRLLKIFSFIADRDITFMSETTIRKILSKSSEEKEELLTLLSLEKEHVDYMIFTAEEEHAGFIGKILDCSSEQIRALLLLKQHTDLSFEDINIFYERADLADKILLILKEVEQLEFWDHTEKNISDLYQIDPHIGPFISLLRRLKSAAPGLLTQNLFHHLLSHKEDIALCLSSLNMLLEQHPDLLSTYVLEGFTKHHIDINEFLRYKTAIESLCPQLNRDDMATWLAFLWDDRDMLEAFLRMLGAEIKHMSFCQETINNLLESGGFRPLYYYLRKSDAKALRRLKGDFLIEFTENPSVFLDDVFYTYLPPSIQLKQSLKTLIMQIPLSDKIILIEYFERLNPDCYASVLDYHGLIKLIHNKRDYRNFFETIVALLAAQPSYRSFINAGHIKNICDKKLCQQICAILSDISELTITPWIDSSFFDSLLLKPQSTVMLADFVSIFKNKKPELLQEHPIKALLFVLQEEGLSHYCDNALKMVAEQQHYLDVLDTDVLGVMTTPDLDLQQLLHALLLIDETRTVFKKEIMLGLQQHLHHLPQIAKHLLDLARMNAGLITVDNIQYIIGLGSEEGMTTWVQEQEVRYCPEKSLEQIKKSQSGVVCEALVKLVRLYRTQQSCQRGGPTFLGQEAQRFVEHFLSQPDLLSWAEPIASYYLEGCVNQPVFGFAEISSWLYVASQPSLEAKFKALKYPFILDFIHKKIKEDNTLIRVEAEKANALLRESCALVPECASWPGLPRGLAFEETIKSWLAQQHNLIELISDKIITCSISEMRDFLFCRDLMLTWAPIAFSSELEKIRTQQALKKAQLAEMLEEFCTNPDLEFSDADLAILWPQLDTSQARQQLSCYKEQELSTAEIIHCVFKTLESQTEKVIYDRMIEQTHDIAHVLLRKEVLAAVPTKSLLILSSRKPDERSLSSAKAAPNFL